MASGHGIPYPAHADRINSLSRQPFEIQEIGFTIS